MDELRPVPKKKCVKLTGALDSMEYVLAGEVYRVSDLVEKGEYTRKRQTMVHTIGGNFLVKESVERVLSLLAWEVPE